MNSWEKLHTTGCKQFDRRHQTVKSSPGEFDGIRHIFAAWSTPAHKHVLHHVNSPNRLEISLFPWHIESYETRTNYVSQQCSGLKTPMFKWILTHGHGSYWVSKNKGKNYDLSIAVELKVNKVLFIKWLTRPWDSLYNTCYWYIPN